MTDIDRRSGAVAGEFDEIQIDTDPQPPEPPVSSPEVSVVVPVYRSADTLGQLCFRIGQTLRTAGLRFEVILVEDCGGDDSWSTCLTMAATIPEVRAFRLSRNFGQHNALLCGIRQAQGSVIVTLDDDLQNPPEEIPKLLEPLREGFDVVYGVPARQETTFARRLSSIAAKRAIQQIGGFSAAPEVNSYRAFRADLAQAFENYRSPHVNIDVLLSWGTERYTSRVVRHEPRSVGRSGYSTFKLIRHALNMITGFSTSPLKAASFVGFGSGLLGFLLMIYVVGNYFIRGQSAPGFAFLASSVALFSGVQLFTIGILGEYLGRLYFGSMGKPDYVVAEHSLFRHREAEHLQRRQPASRQRVIRSVPSLVVDQTTEQASTQTDAGFRAQPAFQLGPRVSRWEWVVAIGVVAAAGAVVLATSRDVWFFADTWPMLAERSLNPITWTKSHGGHLFVPTTMLLQGLFETFGMDFFPWYFLPRTVLVAVGGLALWRVARWRGVDPFGSIALGLLFSWLGVSAWIVTVSYVAPLLIVLCALVAALMIEGWEPTSRPRLLLGAVLTLAIISSAGSGPALWLATTLLLAFTGRLRRFATSVGVPGVLFFVWYMLVARNDPNPLTPELPSLLELLRAPAGMVPHIGAAVASLFSLSDRWSYPGALVLFAAFAVLAWRRRIGRFEATLLLTGVIVAGLGVVVRQAQGIEVNAPNRMHLLVLYLVLPLLMAGMKDATRSTRMLLAVAVAALSALNLGALLDGIDMREETRDAQRAPVETVAALIAQGEPAIGWTSVSPQAAHRHIQTLVDRGWSGELHPELVPEVLISMKTGFFVAEAPFGAPPAVNGLTVDSNGCATTGTAEHRLRIAAQGAIIVQGAQNTTLRLGWEESGVESFTEHVLTEPSHGIAYTSPKPDSEAFLILERAGDEQPITVCGLAPSVES